MMISIGKLKRVIDDLQDAELSYKRQIHAFDKVLHDFKSLDKEGNDKRALRLVAEDLQKEYQQIKKLKMTLSEIVRSYEQAEKNIMNSSSGLFNKRAGTREIDIGDVKKILEDFNITLT
ncbi:MAG: hypothetical protein E7264_06580 [Lachnospiraceae bacterium]|nr:hypothetical protein [Lachnospiraceae bacterium]